MIALGNNELEVSAPHKVGKFKYIIGYNKDNEPFPLEIYIKECQLNITEGYDEYDDGTPISDIWHVESKYKVIYKGKYKWVRSDEIFDTKEDILKSIKKIAYID